MAQCRDQECLTWKRSWIQVGGGAADLGGTVSAGLQLLLSATCPDSCPDSRRCRCCSCCELLSVLSAAEGGSAALLAFASFSSSSEHSFKR